MFQVQVTHAYQEFESFNCHLHVLPNLGDYFTVSPRLCPKIKDCEKDESLKVWYINHDVGPSGNHHIEIVLITESEWDLTNDIGHKVYEMWEHLGGFDMRKTKHKTS